MAAPAGLPAQALLPATGIVRIDDEYCRYGGLAPDGQHLLAVQRGVRQDVHVASSDPAQAQPATQAHAAGTLVVPGGYHLDLPTTTPAGALLYRGGCALADGLGSGDPGFPLAPGATWVGLGMSGLLPPTTTSLPVDAASGVWTQFPPQGVIVLDGAALLYTAKGTTSLDGITPIASSGLQLVPGGVLPPGIHGTGLATQHDDPIILVSLALTGPGALEAGRYTLRAAIPGSAFLAAIEDQAGSTEWLAYDGILGSTTPGTSFLLAVHGFSLARRGQCRTPILDHGAGALLEPVQTELGTAGHWLATGDAVTLLPQPTSVALDQAPSQVPVQVLVRYAATSGIPGANDTTGTPVEAPGDYVAFEGPLPAAAQDPTQPAQQGLSCAHWQLVCGTAWSGDDLSPGVSPLWGPQRSPQPRGCLPREDAWVPPPGTGGTLGDTPRVVVLAEDPLAPAPRTSDATVDDLAAGGLTHPGLGVDGHESTGATTNTVAAGVRLFWIHGQPSATLAATGALDDVVVQATTPLFAGKSAGAPPGLGLVWIDGEAFAYGPLSPADITAIEAGAAALQAVAPQQGVPPAASLGTSGYFAHLLARGLCSDAPPRDHVLGSGNLADNPDLPDGLLHTPVLGAVALPLGPVRLLDGAVASTAWWGVRSTPDGVGAGGWTTLAAPTALVVSPDGSRRELVVPIGPHQADGNTPSLANGYCLPPWLRGLYHTGVVTQDGGPDWSGSSGSLRPVVIGWWPRYPSALAASATYRSQELRCRSLPWAGFPVAVVGGYWDATLRSRLPEPFASMPMLRVPVTPDPLFQVEVRAMGAPVANHVEELDWAKQLPTQIPQTLGDPADASAACQPAADGTQTLSAHGQGATSDGIEVRVDWTYQGTTSTRYEDMAAAGNRAPSLQGAQVRYLAPIRELATVPAP